MTLVMAREEQPMFHDFLGIGRREDYKQRELVISDKPEVLRKTLGLDEELEREVSTRVYSINSGRFEAPVKFCGPSALVFPSSSNLGSERFPWGTANGIQHYGNKSAFCRPEVENRFGKKRDSSSSRDSLQEQLQMNIEALESARSTKVSRLTQEEGKGRHLDMAIDDLHLTMHPPRLSSKCPTHLQSSFKSDLSPSVSNKWDCSRLVYSNTGMLGPARVSHLGPHTEKTSASCSMENTAVTPLLALPPADEGSGTGLKSSSVANLLNNGSSTLSGRGTAGTSLAPSRPTLRSQNPGSESTYISGHQARTLTSRQLTVFYGGQAHVFDDVPPEKAEAIMALAGSSGRSWSTTYSPKPKLSVPPSASEGSHSALERDIERTRSKSSAINGFSSLALSSDLLIASTPQTQPGCGGSNHVGHISVHDHNQLPHLPSEIQAAADCIVPCSNKPERVHTVTKGDEFGRELV